MIIDWLQQYIWVQDALLTTSHRHFAAIISRRPYFLGRISFPSYFALHMEFLSFMGLLGIFTDFVATAMRLDTELWCWDKAWLLFLSTVHWAVMASPSDAEIAWHVPLLACTALDIRSRCDSAFDGCSRPLNQRLVISSRVGRYATQQAANT